MRLLKRTKSCTYVLFCHRKEKKHLKYYPPVAPQFLISKGEMCVLKWLPPHHFKNDRFFWFLPLNPLLQLPMVIFLTDFTGSFSE